MSKKFHDLEIPYQWKNYWTKYPHGYTIYEALVDWISKVNDMVTNVNDWNEYLDDFVDRFDDNLADEVIKTLSEWQESGFLEVVINQALETRMDDLEYELVILEDDISQHTGKLNIHRKIEYHDNVPPNSSGNDGDIALVPYKEGYFELIAKLGDTVLDTNTPITGKYSIVNNVLFFSFEGSCTGEDVEGNFSLEGFPVPPVVDTVTPAPGIRFLKGGATDGELFLNFPPNSTTCDVRFRMNGTSAHTPVTYEHFALSSKTVRIRLNGFYFIG